MRKQGSIVVANFSYVRVRSGTKERNNQRKRRKKEMKRK
jgi:hypothetical protein